MPLLFFLVVMPLALYLAYRRNKARQQAMKKIALQLGLQYQERSPWTAATGPGPVPGQQRAGQPQQGGALGKALLQLTQPVITGKYNGWPVDIMTVNENKTVYTKFRLGFGRNLGLGLRVSANSFFQRDLFGGGPRIESGNEDFDKRVLVRGNDQLKVKFLIKRPEAQRALLDAYRAFAEITVDDQGISCRLRGFLESYQKYQAVLAALCAVAAKLAPAEPAPSADD
ncbi:MAG TPA: hypothetical protein VMF29_09135 [Candidatus Edwardsbacteria bacterium]|nr:hypothetical protein [Candidatus Edwardsbacteria bacterium]